MIKFESKSRNVMEKLHPVWKYVHGFIIIYAHQAMGLDPDNIMGIYKYEGGVSINGKEIAIYRDSVRDDWLNSLEKTPEEQAVVNGIQKFFEKIDLSGEHTVEESMTKMFEEFTTKEAKLFGDFVQNPFSGDPLHMFLTM